jgi:hypothetical protein
MADVFSAPSIADARGAVVGEGRVEAAERQ